MRLAPLDQLVGKTLIIFGLGEEGRSTFEFVRQHVPESPVLLVDDRPVEALHGYWHQALSDNPQVRLVTSSYHVEPRESQTSVVFKTPGIPANHPFVTQLLESGAQLLSNTQLFFELVAAHNETQQGHITTIGITGTKGKSTTTSLIYHVLHTSGQETYLAGNIGTPALEAWQQSQLRSLSSHSIYFVLELSAHQLAELPYSPEIAVIQHVSPEHLDYYQTFDAYIHAKSSIARYQKSTDTVLFNADSETARSIADLSGGTKYGFSLHLTDATCHVENDAITYLGQPVLELAQIPLTGTHNLYNTMPAILIAKLAGITNDSLASAVGSFQALPHRLEFVAEINGVKYFDDSIATTPEAAIAALTAFAGQPIILMAGGYERHQDYTLLAQAIAAGGVKAVALFPPTGQRLGAALANTGIPLLEVETMHDAVAFASRHAQPGDVVLLSPAAASFGMFVDYQDRGNQFRELVLRLPSDNPSSV